MLNAPVLACDKAFSSLGITIDHDGPVAYTSVVHDAFILSPVFISQTDTRFNVVAGQFHATITDLVVVDDSSDSRQNAGFSLIIHPVATP